MRELQAMGIAKEVAAEALADVFARPRRARAHRGRRFRRSCAAGRGSPIARRHARLYQYLMRQGFSPAAIVAALRQVGRAEDDMSTRELNS